MLVLDALAGRQPEPSKEFDDWCELHGLGLARHLRRLEVGEDCLLALLYRSDRTGHLYCFKGTNMPAMQIWQTALKAPLPADVAAVAVAV